jgi:hypothetical protein
VLDDALANTKRQIQPAMRRVPLLKVIDDAQRMNVMVETAAMPLQALVKSALPGVSERRMSDVMNQCQRLGQIFLQPERSCNRPSNLRNFNGMSQSATKVIRRAAGKNLRLPRKPPKGASLHNPLPVPLKRSPRRPKRCRVNASQQQVARIGDDRASMQIGCHSQL